MKVAILGNGKEGQSAERFFRGKGAEIEVFDGFSREELEGMDFSGFDLVMRSPSVPPVSGGDWSSNTKYFFENCPCPIIGVTGTKGKGTTASLISSVLETLGKKVWLIGNIGVPALDVLEKVQKKDVVIYELSSFQLWDLKKSPKVAVVLRIEPDHLNVHKDFADYVQAKANIARWQTGDDFCVFYRGNEISEKIAGMSRGKKIAYPEVGKREVFEKILDSLVLVGEHNRENAEAALFAVASYFGEEVLTFIEENFATIKKGLGSFKGLPHRLEFVRELDGVKFYDDNFATNLPSLEVALKSFRGKPIALIMGGRDKTGGEDFPALLDLMRETENLERVFLIGESGKALKSMTSDTKFVLFEDLETAVRGAYDFSKRLKEAVVLMSPAAASFDMFKSAYERGEKFQKNVKEL